MGESEAAEIVETALDLLIYAPLGLAIGCTELYPDLAERGRAHIRNARAIGKFAVDAGQRKVTETLADGDSPAGDILRGLGLLPDRESNPPDPSGQPAAGSSFPIDGYDDLSAAQIVPLLTGLDPEGLERVKDHETCNRARKTILGKIQQLEPKPG